VKKRLNQRIASGGGGTCANSWLNPARKESGKYGITKERVICDEGRKNCKKLRGVWRGEVSGGAEKKILSQAKLGTTRGDSCGTERGPDKRGGKATWRRPSNSGEGGAGGESIKLAL